MRISASLAAAPLLHLEQTVHELESAGVDYLHFDVEDGSFVPCMNLGTRLISELRPCTRLPFDVHLMMVNPEWLVTELGTMGVQRLSVHYEACPYPRRVLQKIAGAGMTAGLAFNPATLIPDLRYLAPYLAFVVVLTTEPEAQGSPFLPEVLDKVRLGKAAPAGSSLEWIVDGGVKPDNLGLVARAGADTVVVGRSTFSPHRIVENVRLLREAGGA